jgi:hypothetical protein
MLKSLRTVVGGLAIIVGVSLVVAGAHRIIMGRADSRLRESSVPWSSCCCA